MNYTEAILYIKTHILRWEKKRPVKNHVMPLVLLGYISEEDKAQLVNQMRLNGYKIDIDSHHMRIDWTDK